MLNEFDVLMEEKLQKNLLIWLYFLNYVLTYYTRGTNSYWDLQLGRKRKKVVFTNSSIVLDEVL